MKKNFFAAAAAVAAIAASSAAFAIQGAPAAQAVQNTAKVPMSEAIAGAQQALGGEALGARLVQSPMNGLVWSVMLAKEDGTMTRAFVDAQSGKVVASGAAGMARGQGFGPGYGQRGDCRMMGMGRHHSGWF